MLFLTMALRVTISFLMVATGRPLRVGRRRAVGCQWRRAVLCRFVRCLYLAALSVARLGTGHLAATASRLRDAVKPFKLAIVATMRKLLIALNAMVKNNTEYHTT